MAEITYCDAAPGHEWHGPYHEWEYGFPLEDDAALFERLMLEINRNRLKVDAAIANAQTILELRTSHGSFAAGWGPTTPGARRNG